ncbi:MAG: glucosylceramidase [Oscillospiraceae bacterium]|nr:glucosylceramidase [Oscillospiraceae bacterium]
MKATVTVTNLEKNIYWKSFAVCAGSADCMHQVSVYPTVERQSFQGFGGAFTEAAAYAYQQLPENKRRTFMEAYFGRDGLRYDVGRTHINSCDFALGNYACMESSEDEVFHTERDEQYLLPMIRDAEAAAGQAIGLLLSPWSPPAFMKTNGDMNHGGKLREEYRELWASCMAKYVAFYRARGCDVRMVSIQNEPAAVQTWDSCIFSGREEGEFAPILRRALDEAGCADVQILAWDHNKDMFVYRAEETLSVPGAEEAVAGFALHWYTGDHFDSIRFVRERWAGKPIWFTEGCVEYSRFDGMTHLQKAEMYAHDIIGNLNAGISGSIDWNLLLDAKGGPNHVGNFCEAPIMLSEDGTDFEVMSEYYYIGHFSRHIQPGAVCLGSSVYAAEVEAVVFRNPDGERVAVLLNRSGEARPVSLTENAAEGINFVLEPHTIATVQWNE